MSVFLSKLVDLMNHQDSINGILENNLWIDAIFENANNYLMHQFKYWLKIYLASSIALLKQYFYKELALNVVCQDFIQFCFNSNIVLDKSKILHSFAEHDQITDRKIKENLTYLLPKNTLHIMGFGLGEGFYEKELVNYLIANKIGERIHLYGFDPFVSVKDESVNFLSASQLATNNTIKFDLIIARWVLHHVCTKERWINLVHCMNQLNPGGLALIIEHGLIDIPIDNITSRLYQWLNGIFDVIANIGLRPEWFTNSSPLGKNFFINYLSINDFQVIKNSASLQLSQRIDQIGPSFPNQSLCYMQAK